MLPNIAEGEYLTVSLGKRNIKSNDILVFQPFNSNKLICHRIMGIHEEFFICKGDNFSYVDPVVPKENSIGVIKEAVFMNKVSPYRAKCYNISEKSIDPTQKNILVLPSKSFKYVFKKYREKLERLVLMNQNLYYYYGFLSESEIDQVENKFYSIGFV